MTDLEQNRFEAELRRTRPAKLPEDYWSRLLEAARPTEASPVALGPAPVVMGLQRVLRFLIPATVAALFIVVAWHVSWQPKKVTISPQTAAVNSAGSMPPAEVHIAQDLVSSFDALAKLPSGEPVRFQCRRWVDHVTYSDKEHNLVLQESTPRLEVVTVGYETY